MSIVLRKPGTRPVAQLPSHPACCLPSTRFYVTEGTRNDTPRGTSYYYLSDQDSFGGRRTSASQPPPPPPARRIRQNALLRKKPVGSHHAPSKSLLKSRRKLWKKDFFAVRLATIPETREDGSFFLQPRPGTRSSGVRPLPSIWAAARNERPRSSMLEIGHLLPPPIPTTRHAVEFQSGLEVSADSGSSSDDEDLDASEFEFDLLSLTLDTALPVAKFPTSTSNDWNSDIFVRAEGHPEVEISSIYENILRDSPDEFCF